MTETILFNGTVSENQTVSLNASYPLMTVAIEITSYSSKYGTVSANFNTSTISYDNGSGGFSTVNGFSTNANTNKYLFAIVFNKNGMYAVSSSRSGSWLFSKTSITIASLITTAVTCQGHVIGYTF